MATKATYSIPRRTAREEMQETGTCHATLALEGMTCASCALNIEKALNKVSGVKEAGVNLATEQATVTYDPAQTSVEQLVQRVDAVGYQAIPQTGSSAEATKRTHSAVPSVGTPQASSADAQHQRRQAELASRWEPAPTSPLRPRTSPWSRAI